MSITNFPAGVSSFGVPVTQGSVFGKTYFVDATNGSDGNDGLSPTEAIKTITRVMVLAKESDTFFFAPGNYTGNFTTPVNATAPFVRLVGAGHHNNGLASWMGATTSSSPIIDILARGWTIEGFEFDCPTAAAALRLTKSTTGGVNRPDYLTVRNCIFTTGKIGIEVNGGGTHVHIHNNKFDQLTTSGGFGIRVTATGNQIPAFWVVENNIFLTNESHIGPGGATFGFNNSTFKNNTFDLATITMDIRASGGVDNVVVGNNFDHAKGSFATGTVIIGNATDYAAGNHFKDGEQSEKMAGTT